MNVQTQHSDSALCENAAEYGEQIERSSETPVQRPAVDILEAPDAFVLTADMPGVDQDSIDVTLEQKTLTIRGRIADDDRDGLTPLSVEFGEFDFERAFTLSDEIDRDGIDAVVHQGVLRVTLPKARQALSRKIAVKAR